MSDIKNMEQELLELRENTLKEFTDVDPKNMDAQKLEEWTNRNDRMSELVEDIKVAKKFQSEKEAMEKGVEESQKVESKGIHVFWINISKLF